MLKNYFKTAWRNLLKDPQFTCLNLLGFATGLTCALLIFLWVRNELTIDKFNVKDDRLYQVLKKIPDGTGNVQISERTQGLLASTMATEFPEVAYAVPVKKEKEQGIVSVGEKYIKAHTQFAGNDFFNVFSYKLIKGNKTGALKDITGAMISDKLALKLFNTVEVIGKTVNWNFKDFVDFSNVYTITGVFEAPTENATDQFDILFPFDLYAARMQGGLGDVTNWGRNMAYTYLLLKDGANATAFNQKIRDYAKNKISSLYTNKDLVAYEGTLFIRPYSDAYLYNNYVNGVQSGGKIEYVKLFSVIALFILVIACINFMNLSTAKASRRMKEVGIKKVVGANRTSLIIQYISESVLMAFAALVIAIITAALLLPAFSTLTGKNLSLQFNLVFVLSALGITLLTGILAGSYPAFFLSGFKPISILKGKSSSSSSESWIRKTLVVFQFAISAILIVSVMIIYQQMKLVQTTNLGYTRDNIISFANSENAAKNLTPFLSAIRNIPGVVNAATINGNLFGNYAHAGNGVNWDGKDPNLNIEYYGNVVDEYFIEMMGMKIVEGRAFSKNYADDSSVVFNEAAIAAMGIKNPIGKMVSLWGSPKQIIGVVKDYHFESLYKKIGPAFLTYATANPATLVKIKAGAEQSTITQIGSLFSQYNNGLDFTYSFLDDDYNKLYDSEQRVAVLSKYFAGLAIIISCLGLFGLAAFTAQKRKKEISIRKVIGASVGNITAMLTKEFLVLASVALVIALPLAWLVSYLWLQNFAYRITISPLVFIIAALFLFGITLLTVSFQSIKAAIGNPVKSLRSE
jgi:putative ABC transport system permease protein